MILIKGILNTISPLFLTPHSLSPQPLWAFTPLSPRKPSQSVAAHFEASESKSEGERPSY